MNLIHAFPRWARRFGAVALLFVLAVAGAPAGAATPPDEIDIGIALSRADGQYQLGQGVAGVVTVTDAAGEPIAGAQVQIQVSRATWVGLLLKDEVIGGTTDAEGRLVFGVSPLWEIPGSYGITVVVRDGLGPAEAASGYSVAPAA